MNKEKHEEKRKAMAAKLEGNLPAVTQAVATVPPVSADEKDIVDDYEFSRKTYRDLVETANGAIETLVNLAQQAEHPRAFEVLSQMLKNTADMTDKLIDLQKKKKELRDGGAPASGGVSNTAVFIGTTKDLQQSLLKTLKSANETLAQNAPFIEAEIVPPAVVP